MRERGGSTLPAVFKSESAALGWIASRVAKETRLIADEAPSWNDLHARYHVDRIDHGAACSLPGGVYSNRAEEFFSRMRRPEIGHHHHIAGAYLVRYAQESAWREDGQRPPDASRYGAGNELPSVGGLVWILATPHSLKPKPRRIGRALTF
jgi:hypothetical protein